MSFAPPRLSARCRSLLHAAAVAVVLLAVPGCAVEPLLTGAAGGAAVGEQVEQGSQAVAAAETAAAKVLLAEIARQAAVHRASTGDSAGFADALRAQDPGTFSRLRRLSDREAVVMPVPGACWAADLATGQVGTAAC